MIAEISDSPRLVLPEPELLLALVLVFANSEFEHVSLQWNGPSVVAHWFWCPMGAVGHDLVQVPMRMEEAEQMGLRMEEYWRPLLGVRRYQYLLKPEDAPSCFRRDGRVILGFQHNCRPSRIVALWRNLNEC